jgi:hypothetical protein
MRRSLRLGARGLLRSMVALGLALQAHGSQAQVAGGTAGVSQPSRAIPPPNAYAHALFKPVPLFAVKLADDF